LQYDDMKKLLDKVMAEANIKLEDKITRDQVVEDRIQKQVDLELEQQGIPNFNAQAEMERLKNESDSELQPKSKSKTTSLDGQDAESSEGEPLPDIRKKNYDDSSGSDLDDIFENPNDFGKSIFIPDIAPYFVDPLDDSQSFIRGFTGEDIADFLIDETMLSALKSTDNNHLKQIINFNVLQSRNWLYLDMKEFPKEQSIPTVERFGPIDMNNIALDNLDEVFETMLVQDDKNLKGLAEKTK